VLRKRPYNYENLIKPFKPFTAQSNAHEMAVIKPLNPFTAQSNTHKMTVI
jgi:hypothetical protein